MRTQLCTYIGENLLSGRVEVGAEDPLLTSGLLDSLAVIQVVAFLREAFGATIPPEDVTLENFESVARIEAYLDEAGTAP